MTILVIDGQGGKLGKRLVESIKKSFPQVEVMAVGTNSAASESMMRAGADRVATGENPVIVASRTAQIIVGPYGDSPCRRADGRDLSGKAMPLLPARPTGC